MQKNVVVNIKDKFALFKDTWSPKILGEVNNFYIKVFKAQGEFVWHQHHNDDEFFLVVKGQLIVKLREREVTINEGEFFIVPRGTEHCPVAPEEAHVVLFEPKEVVNTGEIECEKTAKDLEWI